MAEAFRVILLVALAAAALTTAALALSWWMETERRLRRAMKKALGSAPEAEAMSPTEGRAAALDFEPGRLDKAEERLFALRAAARPAPSAGGRDEREDDEQRTDPTHTVRTPPRRAAFPQPRSR